MTELDFLGTGNFLAPPGRYWNSFVMDGNVLVEPCPTALPHLRRCGFAVDDIAAEVAKFRAAGFKTRNEIMDFHSRKLVFIEGPEGVTVELSQWH